eukprot:6437848-Pyramimonas_sp.AAC.1
MSQREVGEGHCAPDACSRGRHGEAASDPRVTQRPPTSTIDIACVAWGLGTTWSRHAGLWPTATVTDRHEQASRTDRSVPEQHATVNYHALPHASSTST